MYLASESSTGMQSASASQIILVPSKGAPCQLVVDCAVTYDGQPMNLSPKKVSLTSDSLRVGLMLPIVDQKVVKVIYSVDGKPAYESEELEPFNEKYVSGGDHTLGRRVVFASGATVNDSKSIEHGTIADINYVLGAIFYSQSKVLRIIAIILSLLILWALIKHTLRLVYKKRLWRQTHIASAGTYKLNQTKTGAQTHFYDESIGRSVYRHRKLWLSFLGVFVVFMVVTSYGVGFFTVDGVSMSPTLQDKSVHP